MSVNSKKIGIIYPPPLGIGDQIMSAGSIESIINSILIATILCLQIAPTF